MSDDKRDHIERKRAEIETRRTQMTDTSTWSTTAERFAPGNFVATWNAELGRDAHGVTRAVGNVVEANPLILVKWMHDLSEEWVRAEYLRLTVVDVATFETLPRNERTTVAGSADRPIIDIVGEQVRAAFPSGVVSATWFADGRCIIKGV